MSKPQPRAAYGLSPGNPQPRSTRIGSYTINTPLRGAAAQEAAQVAQAPQPVAPPVAAAAPAGGAQAAFTTLLGGAGGQPPSLSTIPKKISLHSQLPNFKDVQASYRPVLFVSKLRQCCKLVRQEDVELRKLKHMVLYQLLDFINSSNNAFPEIAIPDFFQCVLVNILRATAKPACESYAWDADEDEPQIDVNWYHLQFVYEMLLRFVFSANSPGNSAEYQKLVRKYIDQDFILKLVQLFNSSDPRERDYCKTILHRVYANFMPLRSYIRNVIKSELTSFMNTTQRHNGICEILEILGSIINGFASPLKQEHIAFLAQVLIPLHRVMHIKAIIPQLSYCVSKYVEKDNTLAAGVIAGILGYWPRLSNNKEVSFLTEIDELLETIPPEALLTTDTNIHARLKGSNLTSLIQSTAIVIPNYLKLPEQFLTELNSLKVYRSIFYHISQCLASTHFQVAEKACNMLLNPYIGKHAQFASDKFRELCARYSVTVTPENAYFLTPYNVIYTIAKPLSFNAASHWNVNIKIASEGIFKTIAESDPETCKNLEEQFLRELVQASERKEERARKWEAISAVADSVLEDSPDDTAGASGADGAGDTDPGAASGDDGTIEYDLTAFSLGAPAPDAKPDSAESEGDGFETGEHKERSLNPNLVPFDRDQTSFVPGYRSECIVSGAVSLAQVPPDPLNRVAIAGMKSMSIGEDNVRRLHELFEQERQKAGSSDVSLYPLAARNGLFQPITEGLLDLASGRRTQLPNVAEGKRRLANRRANAGIQPGAMNIRRKSLTPVSMEVKVAKAELSNYVSPSGAKLEK